MEDRSSRRDFLQFAVTAASVTALAEEIVAQTSSATASGLPTRLLGRTGQRVSIIGIGGGHIGGLKDDGEAIRIVQMAADEGITFFDNAWEYSEGLAEDRMGRALATGNRREKVFLMTKNCERDYEGSKRDLEESLRRLRTDHLDLWQFHEINYDNDPDWVFDKGGIRAALEAQKAGKVRFIGFTGHKDPRIHLRMLSQPFDWDTVQMPINVMDAHYRSFQNQVVPVCLSRKIGVLGMKGMGGGAPRGRINARAGLSPSECYRYCLSLPVSTQILGITTVDQLKENIAMARNFQPMSAEEKNTLLARVKDEATDGRHELFKSTSLTDGAFHRKQHGFDVAGS
jgi:predicted aldo/keto reductase-like oxidoreductase